MITMTAFIFRIIDDIAKEGVFMIRDSEQWVKVSISPYSVSMRGGAVW